MTTEQNKEQIINQIKAALPEVEIIVIEDEEEEELKLINTKIILPEDEQIE